MSRIAVIGGGLSGLSAAHYVRKLIPSARVSLFEKNSDYGGWLKTIQVPVSPNVNVPIELGPNSIRGGNDEKSKVTAQLIADLNLTDQIIPPSENAKTRLIYHNNKLSELQKITRRYMLPTMIWMPLQQICYHFMGGHKNRYKDESIAEFFTRNFGKNMSKIIASSFVNGVYGGGINHLSIKACSPLNKMKEMEIEYGSIFVGGLQKMMKQKSEKLEKQKNEILNENNENAESNVADLSAFGSFTFCNGLQQLTDALVDRLQCDENVSLFNNFDINSLRYASDNECIEMLGNEQKFEFDHVINAIQPRNCSSFLNVDFDLNAFNLSASLITVNVIFKKREFVEKMTKLKKFEGFGVLIPRELNDAETFCYDDDNSLLGIIYYSSVFPLFEEGENENDAMSLVFMFGGPQFDIYGMTKEEVVRVCKAKMKKMYGVNVDEENENEIVCDMMRDDPLDMFSLNNGPFVNADIVFNINRLNNAIDHYQVGHMKKKESLYNELAKGYGDRLSVVGSGYDGVGIPDCILSAYKSVENIAKSTEQNCLEEKMNEY